MNRYHQRSRSCNDKISLHRHSPMLTISTFGTILYLTILVLLTACGPSAPLPRTADSHQDSLYNEPPVPQGNPTGPVVVINNENRAIKGSVGGSVQLAE